MKPHFRTPAVSRLFDQLQAWSHPEHPFLDPNYSPGGYYPVTDFTTVVAGWIANRETDAIAELWSFLTSNGVAEKEILRRGLCVRVDARWCLDDESSAELSAINLLGLRMALQDNSLNRSSTARTTTDLFSSRLASTAWRPPIGMLEILRENAAIQADVEDGPQKRLRKRKQAEEAIEELMRDAGEDVETVGQWMVRIPPMARLVIVDYFTRDWGAMSLRPDLYYGDRQYGCSAALNIHFIQWIGCFQEPTDEDDPKGVTKAEFAESLQEAGINFKKSAKRSELEAVARCHLGLVASIIKKYSPKFVRPKSEWKSGLQAWVSRCQKLRCISAAMLTLMAENSLIKSPR